MQNRIRDQDPAPADPRAADDDSQSVAYETGARKPLEGENLRFDGVHTGDRGDEPKHPYGLTEPSDDRGDATGHHDGVKARELEAQFVGSKADPRNSGMVNAEPRVISGDEDVDATVPLRQGERR